MYPGARPTQGEDSDPLNLSILTESLGMKVVVAKYESDDAPAKILAYYRDKLKKYGKVLECHGQDGHGLHTESGGNERHSKELNCEGGKTGPVTELKAGTADDQHAVAIEPRDDGKTSFVIVYVYSRGKRGEI